VAGLLGFNPADYIVASYRDLYMLRRIDTPGAAHEMIF